MKHKLRHYLLGLVPIMAAAFLAAPSWADGSDEGEIPPPDLVVFGDSLSDPGNVYLVTGLSVNAPYEVIPAAPYEIGRFHFSNGDTWAERLAERLGSHDSAEPAMEDPAQNDNFAFGGARARPFGQSPSAVDQVSLFLQARAGAARADDVHVLQFGGNDLRDALVAATVDINLAFAIISDAVASTAASIQLLYDAGAKRFLVANVPNLGHAPAIVALGASGEATFLTSIYNGLLEGALQGLEAYSDIEIHRLDMFGFINAVVANPQAFGIDDTTTPCLTFGVVEGAVCDDPGAHLFWDGIHPTKKAHAKMAKEAIGALSSAP